MFKEELSPAYRYGDSWQRESTVQSDCMQFDSRPPSLGARQSPMTTADPHRETSFVFVSNCVKLCHSMRKSMNDRANVLVSLHASLFRGFQIRLDARSVAQRDSTLYCDAAFNESGLGRE
jgi:hypothetical protein